MTPTAAELLRSARIRAGLSQRGLARLAGVRQPMVAAYEAGRRQPTLTTLHRLVRAAGQELDVVAYPASRLPDPARSGHRLEQVLELADRLPRRRRRPDCDYPRLPSP